MNLTIFDIAKEAGVSTTTISRVLAGSTKVKNSTREKVLRVIEKHHYEPSEVARNLTTRKTNTIGLIIDEISNPFFVDIASAVEEILQTRNFMLMLSSSQWKEEREFSIVRNMIRQRVEGLLIAPINPDSPTIDFLDKRNIPFVLLNSYSTKFSADCVTTDNIVGGYLAGSHLVKQDIEQLLLITGYTHQSIDDRVEGFFTAVQEAEDRSLPVSRYENINTYKDGYSLATILMVRNSISTKKSGIFVTNDNVAMGLLDGLLEQRIQVPETVQLIGYDNIDFAARYKIPLTTVSQSRNEMGKIAALELLAKIENHEKVQRILKLPPKLIVRQSTRGENP
jgi:LacI family transcriptional regulator